MNIANNYSSASSSSLIGSTEMLKSIQSADVDAIHKIRTDISRLSHGRYLEKKSAFSEATELYMKTVISAVQQTIQEMYKTGKKFAYVSKEAYITSYQVTINNILYTFNGDILHYGNLSKTSGGYHTKRDLDTWKKMDIEQPFKVIQRNLAEKGFFLYDVSDPSKSFNIFWILRIEKMEKLPILWHGLNVIP